MLRPFLLIGVGGSGGKTLRGIKYQLELKLQQLGWTEGIPKAWQFLHFDTPTAQDGIDFALPFLPSTEYQGLVSSGATYQTVHATITNAHAAKPELVNDVKRQIPDPRTVKVDVTKGAGQYRAVGRAVALAATKDIARAARESIAKLTDASALAQLTSLGEKMRTRSSSGDSSPTVIVISSIAGGSGAGQFLDIIEIVKSTVKQHPWSNQFFSFLYAPDVFDQVKGNAGMSGNALASITETMNGFWSTGPSDSTLELLRTQGVAPSYGNAMDRIGAAYPFIIGRSNSKVTFEDQSAVYNAVATSLTAWITDERVQDDMIAYSSGNWQARVGANVLPDRSGLMRPVRQAPPFSSMGFGRVTLGRERFLEYAAERFARSAIDIILFKHAEADPQFERMTERAHIEERADAEYQRFLRDLKLNEETEEHNDVINALRDEESLRALKGELATRVQDRLLNQGGFDKTGGLDISTWTERLGNEYAVQTPDLLRRDVQARQVSLDRWIREMPEHLLRVVAASIASNGLPTVVAMLDHLDRALKSTVDGLRSEGTQYQEWARDLRSLIFDELRPAPNQTSIRPDQAVVGNAIERLAQAFEWTSESGLRFTAASLVEELRGTFLAPLTKHLGGAYSALRQRTADKKTVDNRDNEFEFWPTRTDHTVPRKFTPAPNERLLISEQEYPGEFERLVSASIDGGAGKYEDDILKIVVDQLLGESGAPNALIRNPRSWRPSVQADPETSIAPTLPTFSVDDDPETYRDRAKEWMRLEGTPFNAYIGEDLLAFLDVDQLAPDVYSKRRDRFREQLQSALGASEPLVKLNSALLRAVHDKAVNEGTSLVFSSIPFRPGTEMYELTKGVLADQHFWDDSVSEGWFRDQSVDSIEVFAMSGFPYQPIVMDSVMEPIARGWLEQSNSLPSREAFWLFKRSRLLGEAIPADPEVIAAMLRGWYVAKTLTRLRVDAEVPGGSRGPKISVWDPAARADASFPHPLLSAGIAQARDYPGVVLQSLAIALVLCNSSGSIDPLRPYQQLAELGGDRGPLAEESALFRWLVSGTVVAGAPAIDERRAGPAAGELADRQLAIKAYLEQELANFTAGIVEQDPSVSVYDYPPTWEIRELVDNVIRDLISAVMATRADDSGV